MGDPGATSRTDEPTGGPTERLWTPWRMRYVGGGDGGGCVFCERLAGGDDVRSLILHRGERAFAIMNLYPYNTGHLMLVPTAHVADPADADPAALAELAALLPAATRALRRALGCHGFNVGLNIGAVAGAGVADHLHQHLVPRWQGDANFMPILASTMVLPELIPVTYAKLRAELARDLTAAGGSRQGDRVAVVLLAEGDSRVFARGVGRSGEPFRLPEVEAGADEPLWRAAVRAVGDVAAEVEVAGWAGPTRADERGPAALVLRAVGAPGEGGDDGTWLRVGAAGAEQGGSEGETVRRALANLAPPGPAG